MTFCEALEYIHSLLKFGIHPGLSRMDTLLQILGNPHKNIKCVHVAGTNGKGSTSTAISLTLGSGGGRKDVAQGGGKDVSKLNEALEILKGEL